MFIKSADHIKLRWSADILEGRAAIQMTQRGWSSSVEKALEWWGEQLSWCSVAALGLYEQRHIP